MSVDVLIPVTCLQPKIQLLPAEDALPISKTAYPACVSDKEPQFIGLPVAKFPDDIFSIKPPPDVTFTRLEWVALSVNEIPSRSTRLVFSVLTIRPPGEPVSLVLIPQFGQIWPAWDSGGAIKKAKINKEKHKKRAISNFPNKFISDIS